MRVRVCVCACACVVLRGLRTQYMPRFLAQHVSVYFPFFFLLSLPHMFWGWFLFFVCGVRGNRGLHSSWSSHTPLASTESRRFHWPCAQRVIFPFLKKYKGGAHSSHIREYFSTEELVIQCAIRRSSVSPTARVSSSPWSFSNASLSIVLAYHSDGPRHLHVDGRHESRMELDPTFLFGNGRHVVARAVQL